MSYFSHAFQKAFPVVAETGTSGATGAVLDNGFVTNTGIHTGQLRTTSDDLVNAPFNSNVGPVFGMFNRDSYLSVNVGSAEVVNGAPLVLAGSSIIQEDKNGKFHGGYAESNKSKYINPKYVHAAYKMSAQTPQQSIWHIGVTNSQPGTSISITTAGVNCASDGVYQNVPVTGGSGTGFTVDIEVVGGVIVSAVENQVGFDYTVGDVITLDTSGIPALECDTNPTFTIDSYGAQDCEFDFLCGETYNLFINLNGNPVLRLLNHDAYRNLAAYAGCCPDDAIEPVPVDSTLIMIDWAKQISEDPFLKEFVKPMVFDEEGNPWFQTEDDATDAGWPATQVWDNYVSTGHINGALGGIRLIGAYVDTKFGNCTFQTSDYFEKDFVRMDISLSNDKGQPCDFQGLCIEEECCGYPGQGFGDTYLKEIIQAERYLQNDFNTDPRIREILQQNDTRDVLDRFAFYDKYVIQHTVPRTNNPSSQHNDDQYNLAIYVPQGTDLSTFETLIATWLTNSGNPLGADITANDGFEDYGDRTPCVVSPIPTP